MMIAFLTLFSTISVSYSQTIDSATVDNVLKQLKIQPKDCYFDLVVQQVIPYSPDKSVVVIPKIIEEDEYSFSCDFYLLIINNDSGLIQNTFFEPNSLISDAVRIDNISIDFAPYNLNATTRAFGVRILYEGSSRANPYENEDISLFIPQDSLLVRVLKNYSIASITGEWDTNCNGYFVTEKAVLIISDKKTNNYCDIKVKNETTTTIQTQVNDDCKEDTSVTNKTSILKYDKDKNEYIQKW